MNRALVEIDDLTKDLNEVALQTQWEVENIDASHVDELLIQEDLEDELLIQEDYEDELLVQEDSPINYYDIVGYVDGRDYSTNDTYPY
jgi:hypothetical protein